MSVRETVTKLNLATLIAVAITANGVTNGTPVDGKDDELGLSFFMHLGNVTDGTFTLSLEDSADDGAGAPLGDWTAIPANKIVHGGSDDPAQGGVTDSPSEVGTADTGASNQTKLGVFSERRWTRPVVTAAGVTSGVDLVFVNVAKSSEYLAA